MNYERASDSDFPAPAYRISEHPGIAWHVLGWEVESDSDTEWSGVEVRTGCLVCRMVGDDRDYRFDPSDLIPLDRENYCGVCGQIGCAHG